MPRLQDSLFAQCIYRFPTLMLLLLSPSSLAVIFALPSSHPASIYLWPTFCHGHHDLTAPCYLHHHSSDCHCHHHQLSPLIRYPPTKVILHWRLDYQPLFSEVGLHLSLWLSEWVAEIKLRLTTTHFRFLLVVVVLLWKFPLVKLWQTSHTCKASVNTKHLSK